MGALMQSFIFSPIESLLKSCILENSFVSCFLPILNIALCVCVCVVGGEWRESAAYAYPHGYVGELSCTRTCVGNTSISDL